MASTTYEFLAHDDKHYKLWMTALGTVVRYVWPRLFYAPSIVALTPHVSHVPRCLFLLT